MTNSPETQSFQSPACDPLPRLTGGRRSTWKGAAERPQLSETKQQWLIGTGDDCDLKINCPYVSRRHCRLTKIGTLYLLEDLSSRNGTLVNGKWLTKSAVVTRADKILLGTAAALPWPRAEETEPTLASRVIRIGRALNNDVVIPDATVSQHHAEVHWIDGEAELVDLGSTNGTFLCGSHERVGRTSLAGESIVRFGSFRILTSLLLQGGGVVSSDIPTERARQQGLSSTRRTKMDQPNAS